MNENGKTAEAEPQGEYGAEAIRILEGLEAVRVRPAMYIGSTGESGLQPLEDPDGPRTVVAAVTAVAFVFGHQPFSALDDGRRTFRHRVFHAARTSP